MNAHWIEQTLGDNSGERRIRLLGSICTLVAVGVLVWYYWADKRAITQQIHTTGRLLAEQAMLREHWKSLEVKSEFKVLIQDLGAALSNRSYEWRILSRVEGGMPQYAPRDEVDAKMLQYFTAFYPSRDANSPDPASKEYRYYQPIWAQTSCLSCHRSSSPSDTLWIPAADAQHGSLREGSLLGVVAITMAHASSQYPLHVNRWMLLSTVVVTLLLIMTATSCILRWPAGKRSDETILEQEE
jgi:hypothetical protein